MKRRVSANIFSLITFSVSRTKLPERSESQKSLVCNLKPFISNIKCLNVLTRHLVWKLINLILMRQWNQINVMFTQPISENVKKIENRMIFKECIRPAELIYNKRNRNETNEKNIKHTLFKFCSKTNDLVINIEIWNGEYFF